jgi:hypothetical protein
MSASAICVDILKMSRAAVPEGVHRFIARLAQRYHPDKLRRCSMAVHPVEAQVQPGAGR